MTKARVYTKNDDIAKWIYVHVKKNLSLKTLVNISDTSLKITSVVMRQEALWGHNNNQVDFLGQSAW